MHDKIEGKIKRYGERRREKREQLKRERGEQRNTKREKEYRESWKWLEIWTKEIFSLKNMKCWMQ